jgi:transcriptional regulator with XRE-family HTH domain
MTTPFSDLLRAFRNESRFSQMDLGHVADVSQRHLSFLESGRALPGRDVVIRLSRGLNLTAYQTNHLLASAGFAAAFPAREIKDDTMAPLRRAASAILRAHSPFPAVLIDEATNVLEENAAFSPVLALLGDPKAMWAETHGGKPRNLLRLTMHPAGPAKAMVNFEDVARATLQRCLAEAPQSKALEGILNEVRGFPGIKPEWLKPLWGPAPAPVIEERYHVKGQIIGVFAVVTTLGAPMDLVAGGLRIETYFPIDDFSEEKIRQAQSAA